MLVGTSGVGFQVTSVPTCPPTPTVSVVGALFSIAGTRIVGLNASGQETFTRSFPTTSPAVVSFPITFDTVYLQAINTQGTTSIHSNLVSAACLRNATTLVLYDLFPGLALDIVAVPGFTCCRRHCRT